MSFTNLCATLRNYQNVLIHISESRVDSTIINYDNKIYEFKWGPLRLIG